MPSIYKAFHSGFDNLPVYIVPSPYFLPLAFSMSDVRKVPAGNEFLTGVVEGLLFFIVSLMIRVLRTPMDVSAA